MSRLNASCPFLAHRYINGFFDSVKRKYGIDVWHATFGYPAGEYLIQYALGHNVPHLVRCTGNDIQVLPEIGYGMRLDPKMDRRVRKWLPKAQRLVAITDSVADEYRSVGARNDQIAFIPNGVDVSRFQMDVDRKAVLSSLGVDPETFVFTSISRNHPKKNFPTLIRAAAHLKTLTDKPFSVVIAGAGVKELQAQAGKDGVADIIHLHEKVGEVRFADGDVDMPPTPLVELYRAADAFIFPTLIETFGIVIVEAMAAGLPVIVGDAPGARDVVRNGQDATMVDPMDYKGFSREMLRLMEEKEYRGELSGKSLKRARDFDWETITDQYVDLYRKLISELGNA